jgi:hypothetical protein
MEFLAEREELERDNCPVHTCTKTLRTLEGYQKYTKNPRFERNWNKSRPYQK